MTISGKLSSPGMVLGVSLALISATLSANLLIPVLPVSGLAFAFIALLVWFIALFFTFVGLHKLLQTKEPISSAVFNKYFRYGSTTPQNGAVETQATITANADSIRRLAVDIDRFFISRWYCDISSDQNFPIESKVFLQEVLTRVTEVTLQMNSNSLLHGVLNIFLKHLKEFRRGLKRRDKYRVAIEDVYRYSHVCSISSNQPSLDYFMHQLTISLLHPFINSELWNSLPCHILVSILARKLMYYLLTQLSCPQVLNYLILNSLACGEVKEKLQLEKYGQISIVEFFDVIDDNNQEEKAKPPVKPSGVASVQPVDLDRMKKAEELQREVEEATAQLKKDARPPVEVNPSKPLVVLRQRGLNSVVDGQTPTERSPSKRGDVVKIYEPKSSAKTWRDSRDLACVSLGQDPLDMLVIPPDSGGKIGTKPPIWEPSAKPGDSKHDSPPSASHLFNEVMQMTSMEGLKTSIKPLSDVTERTLHNIKDLQEATVHKIGDFQVTDKPPIDPLNYLHYLPPNTLLHSSVLSNTQRLHAPAEDEAAGMVEGILDFGRAGFRKGLRLTGLQDNIENAKTLAANSNSAVKSVAKPGKKKLDDLKEKTSSADSADSTVWINPLQFDSPNYDGQILLEKATGRPDLESNPRIENLPIPSISTEDASGTDSPDPEYEDAADLASSIAKLRSLLQQRSSESSLSTPAVSPMPDEYSKQVESEGTSDAETLEVDGVMPSFYKFCTKTASGVFSNTFNTIKTALPGNNTENLYTVELWKFVTDQKPTDTLIRMKKLLSERKEYCVLDKEIEAAYDALDSVDIFQQSPKLIPNIQFEDELEDFEGKLPITKVIFDIVCELLVDTSSSLIQEPVIKAALLLFGTALEEQVATLMKDFLEHLAESLVTIPEKSNTRVLSMDIEEYVGAIENSSPDKLRFFVGQDNFKSAIRLLISSLQKPRINQDVVLQGFELIAMRLIEESLRISPPASA
uniref:PXA domain-containing protein n=1 Tax=Dendroctonus ponderosae TaxID=77166 RepID=A0AAR5QF37_DENPD